MPAAALFILLILVGIAPAHAEIRIATEGAYPPFNYIENGQPAGFEIDLGRAFCEAMKTPCVFVLQEWDELNAGLKAGKYDAIMSSMEITAERRTRYRFSQPYYRIPATLIARKDEPEAGAPVRAEHPVRRFGEQVSTRISSVRASGTALNR